MAVRSFLDERPFHQRRPWYFGDDVTDEGAFELVQTLGGVAVKIGEGETLAVHRLPDPPAMRRLDGPRGPPSCRGPHREGRIVSAVAASVVAHRGRRPAGVQ